MAWWTATSCTAGLYFASGQFCLEQLLNDSSVNEGDGACTVLTFLALPRRANELACTSRTRSISPSCSARSTASVLPYLMIWIWSNFGFCPRQFGLRSIVTMRPCWNFVATYGPEPTSGIFGLYEPRSVFTDSLPQTC